MKLIDYKKEIIAIARAQNVAWADLVVLVERSE